MDIDHFRKGIWLLVLAPQTAYESTGWIGQHAVDDVTAAQRTMALGVGELKRMIQRSPERLIAALPVQLAIIEEKLAEQRFQHNPDYAGLTRSAATLSDTNAARRSRALTAVRFSAGGLFAKRISPTFAVHLAALASESGFGAQRGRFPVPKLTPRRDKEVAGILRDRATSP